MAPLKYRTEGPIDVLEISPQGSPNDSASNVDHHDTRVDHRHIHMSISYGFIVKSHVMLMFAFSIVLEIHVIVHVLLFVLYHRVFQVVPELYVYLL